jgi:CheY-like chemotaxis protein
MDDENIADPACPYCGLALHWVANRWFGRGCFQCEQCGDFPDFRGAGIPALLFGEPCGPASPVADTDTRPRVLLVDDSSAHRDLYALMLESAALVQTASRGEDALILAGANPPDAIILDVMMPGVDGWHVCETLKRNPLTAAIPIIMLTSCDTADVPSRAREVGAAAVLMKPCPPERLALTLDAAIRGHVSPLG